MAWALPASVHVMCTHPSSPKPALCTLLFKHLTSSALLANSSDSCLDEAYLGHIFPARHTPASCLRNTEQHLGTRCGPFKSPKNSPSFTRKDGARSKQRKRHLFPPGQQECVHGGLQLFAALPKPFHDNKHPEGMVWGTQIHVSKWANS